MTVNSLCTRSCEFRASDATDTEGRMLRGYAAVFNTPTRINSWEGRFDEIIAPGAFKKTLRERKPIMQWNHGFDPAVGQIPIGVFERLTEDEHGLDVEGPLHDDPVAERVRVAIRSGAVTGMSFKFQVIRDEWRDGKGKLIKDPNKLYSLIYGKSDDSEGVVTRTIKEVRLYEAGPVATPAYAATTVGVRSLDDVPEQERQEIVAAYARHMVVDADDEPDESRSATAQITQSDPDEGRAEDDEMNEDGLRKSDPDKPYGDVPYADPGYQKDGKKRYPIDTKEHVKAAWSYINQKANAAKYSADQVAKIKSKIKAAAKKFGVDISDDSKKSDDTDTSDTRGAVQQDTPPVDGDRTDAAPAGTSVRDDKQTNDTRKVKAMNLEQLRARRDEIVKRLAAITDEHRDAELPDEARTEFDSLKDELGKRESAIKDIEERQSYVMGLAQRAEGQTDTPARGAESGSDRGTPAFVPQRDIFDVEDLAKRSLSGEDFVTKVRDNAKHAIERAVYGVDDDAKAREHVSRLLRTVDTKDAQLAKRILLTGSDEYTRAFAKVLRHGSDAFCTDDERRALLRAQSLQGGTPAGEEGGYAVPFQLDPTVILTNAGVINPIRNLARVETIVGRKWQGLTTAGTTAVRGTETTTAPDSSFTLEQPELDTNRVQAFVPYTIEIELSWDALSREITRVLVDAKEREEDSFVTGDGTTGVQPGGIVGSLNASSHVTTAAVTTFADEDVYAVQNALNPRWEPRAAWLAHKAIYHLIRQFDTSGGGMFWGSLAQGNPNTLLDYPIHKSSAMDSTIAANDLILLHGDFSQFLIVDRLGMRVELVPHVFDSANGNRPTGQRGVYAVWMNNSKILVHDAFRLLKVRAV